MSNSWRDQVDAMLDIADFPDDEIPPSAKGWEGIEHLVSAIALTRGTSKEEGVAEHLLWRRPGVRWALYGDKWRHSVLVEAKATAGMPTRERLLLSQLQRNEQNKLGEVLGDENALEYFRRVWRANRVSVEELAAWFSNAGQWLSFARIVRADLVRHADDMVYLTGLGTQQGKKWFKERHGGRRTQRRATKSTR